MLEYCVTNCRDPHEIPTQLPCWDTRIGFRLSREQTMLVEYTQTQKWDVFLNNMYISCQYTTIPHRDL